jgi:hypothetical protein
MEHSGFHSPEDAAMNGFPPGYRRVVASRVDGDDAYVLLNTGSDAQPYLYGANCHRRDGVWFESGSSNGPGWAQVYQAPDIGTLSFWDDAPAGVSRVRVKFDGALVEEVVRDRAFLVVWWRRPPPTIWPQVIEVEMGGRWAPTDGTRRGRLF